MGRGVDYGMGRGIATVLLSCLVGLGGCGYHAVGTAAHLPQTVHTLAVPVFQNDTQSYHTEVLFTQAVIKELSSRTSYRLIAGHSANADATLDGTITSFRVTPLTYNSQTGQSSSFLITIQARVKLVDRDGRVLYQNPSYLFRQQYETTQDLVTFIQENGPAEQRLATDFAQSVVSDILESF
ncbi:MAG TPA: LptE family protein [Acidobacteriaceae bacterium]|nr:LptE family protein [Acidobacteriaceae bacterium]